MSINQLRVTESSKSSPKPAIAITAPSSGNMLSFNDEKCSKLQSNIKTETLPKKQKESESSQPAQEGFSPNVSENQAVQRGTEDPGSEENLRRISSTQAPSGTGEFQAHPSVPMGGQYLTGPRMGSQGQPPMPLYGTAMPKDVGENGVPIQRTMVPNIQGPIPANVPGDYSVPSERQMLHSFVNGQPRHVPPAVGQIPEAALGRVRMPEYRNMPNDQQRAFVNRLPMDNRHMPRNIPPVRFGAEYPGSQGMVMAEQRMQFFNANGIRPAQPEMSHFGHTY